MQKIDENVILIITHQPPIERIIFVNQKFVVVARNQALFS